MTHHLRFTTLDAALAHARKLQSCGYERTGNWTLGQTCRHIGGFMEMSRLGFPTGKGGVTAPPGAFLFGWAIKWMLLNRGFAKGLPAPRILVFGDFADDAAGVAGLASEVAAFEAHRGAFASSPLLGRMSGEDWRRLHLKHCEHHFQFLRPTTPTLGVGA